MTEQDQQTLFISPEKGQILRTPSPKDEQIILYNEAAVVPNEHGTLKLLSVEKYHPEKGEMLIRNYAVAMNPIDHKIQKSDVYSSSFRYPAILGCDIVGRVEELGEGTSKFALGDIVFSWTPAELRKENRFGAFQHFSITDERTTAKVPSNISLEEAAGLGLAPATAANALFGDLHIPVPANSSRPTSMLENSKILFVNGGSSAVGSAAVQLGVLAGLKVFASCTSKNSELVKSFGAHETFDCTDKKFCERVKEKLNGCKITYLLDTIASPESQHDCMELLDNDGTFVSVLPLKQEVQEECYLRGIKPINTFVGSLFVYDREDLLKWWFPFLYKILESGSFIPLKPEVIGFGLQDIQSALDHHASGKVSGRKLVVRLMEPVSQNQSF